MFQIKVSFKGFKELYQVFLSFLKDNYPDSITDDLLINIPKE
jgi:hypothetical protein